MPDRRPTAFAIAWAGTAAFAGSLLWFLYSYLVRFVDPLVASASRVPTASDSATAAIVVNLLLFAVFAVHHSVLARTGAKRYVHTLVPPELERSLYTWVASLLFAAVCWWWRPVPGTLYHLDGIARVLAYAVQFAGLALTIQASRLLDVLDLSGVRPVERAASSAPPQHVPLKTDGLYGFVRHPLYFAWALFVFAAPDMTATRFTFAAISTLYLALAIPFEERALVGTFGAAYQDYRRTVRSRMIPGIY
jgi:protein-S-isoprenylcysteine O-methyltransferase Ste14